MREVALTEIGMALRGTPTIREAMIGAVASRIARRENGGRIVGYNDEHRHAAVEYVDAMLEVLMPSPPVEEA